MHRGRCHVSALPRCLKREQDVLRSEPEPGARHPNSARGSNGVKMVYPSVKNPVSVPNGTPDKTLFVSVGESFGKGLKDPKTGNIVPLEDCARGYWRERDISDSHGYDCEYLMATVHGKIVGVWRIDRNCGWKRSQANPITTRPIPKEPPSRRVCELIPVEDSIWNRFVGCEIHLGRHFSPLRGYFIR